eukprot:1316901-Pleurochrysis_carterae.AAC.1
MTRCRAESESVLRYPYSGPHQYSGQRPNGLGLPGAPPLHRWSRPSKADVPRAHLHKPQPQTPS